MNPIKSHLDFCYQTLELGKEVKISSLIDSYLKINSSLHQKAGDQKSVDVSAFCYSLDRLPEEIFEIRKIIFGQRFEDFKDFGCSRDFCLESASKARRRKQFFNPAGGTLFVLLASDSDIEDLVNILIVFQIERNKISRLIKGKEKDLVERERFDCLGISDSEWQKLKKKLGADWQKRTSFLHEEIDISVILLSRDDSLYQKTADDWFSEVVNKSLTTLENRSVYFVSSNLHSLINIVAGFPAKKQVEIFDYIEKNHPDLWQEFLKIKTGKNVLRTNDYLYYISKIYLGENEKIILEKNLYEGDLGIRKTKPMADLDCEAQVIPVSAIAKSVFLDPYLRIKDKEKLLESEAIILNINYPLGMAAYYLMNSLLKNLHQLKAVYIVGKAAILTGNIGDTQIAKMVFDERTERTYEFKNIFNEHFPFQTFQGEIWQNEESVSVFGTLLENREQLENYIKNHFNIIEMESAPYLRAISENTNSSLKNLPFDLGVINYASDNPLSEKNLGEGSLALKGVEPTYLALLAVCQRIVELEEK